MSSNDKLTRDQRRAFHAYQSVGKVPEKLRDDYTIAVHDLGATILRSGLAAAMAALERQKSKENAVELLLTHLAGAEIPGLTGLTGNEAGKLPGRVRGLEVEAYMLATRELLKVVVWFRRAVQANAWDG